MWATAATDFGHATQHMRKRSTFWRHRLAYLTVCLWDFTGLLTYARHQEMFTSIGFRVMHSTEQSLHAVHLVNFGKKSPGRCWKSHMGYVWFSMPGKPYKNCQPKHAMGIDFFNPSAHIHQPLAKEHGSLCFGWPVKVPFACCPSTSSLRNRTNEPPLRMFTHSNQVHDNSAWQGQWLPCLISSTQATTFRSQAHWNMPSVVYSTHSKSHPRSPEQMADW